MKTPLPVRRHRQAFTTELQASPPGSRNSWWLAVCPKHGETGHLSMLGGACERCHAEGLEARGLVARTDSEGGR